MSATNLKVKIFAPDGTQVLPVAKSNLSMGSAKHCDVVVAHETVHGEHLRAWFDGGRVWIQDMGSPHGTFLNGIRLPALKPMLVRELDVLKLGENPATFGLEASLVRQPVVRAVVSAVPPSAEEVTAPGRAVPKDAELEKRRDELAKLRREMAEIKLQLQMAKLDKNSEDEAHRQLSRLRNEIHELTDQKSKVERTIKQMDQHRQSQLAAVDKEINERKTTAMNQLKNLMDHEMSKLADWKMQVMGTLRKDIQSISHAKAKSWVTRPLSQDMILEWEADVQALLRKAILGESAALTTPLEKEPVALPPTPVVPSTPPKLPKLKLRELDEATHVSHSGVSKSSFTGTPGARLRRAKSRRPQSSGFKNFALFTLVAGLVGGAFAVKKGYINLKGRSLAAISEMSGSSVQSTAPVTQPTNKVKFEPKMTRGFKKSYTDNVLYTDGYLESEMDPKSRSAWLVDLTKAATGAWKLDVTTARVIAEKELLLIQDLKRIRDGIDGAAEADGIRAMRDRETIFQRDVALLAKGKVTPEKIGRLKKSFFTRTQSKNP